jgi:flavin reductase (DIM6/NTAB) family NADH-FMN oxidoreductase RutF
MYRREGTKMSKVKLGSQSSLYPYPATIISIEVEGRKNYMQLGFVGIVNAYPGMVAMGIGRHHHTAKALEKGKVFGLAIADEDMLLKADYVGIRPGDKFDKSEVFQTFKGDNGADLITESPINLEVKILEVLDLGGFDYTVIAEILEVYADEGVMTGKNPDIEKINPIMLSMYENRYFKVGDYVGDAWRDGLEYESLKALVVETIFPAYDRLANNDFFKAYIDANSVFVFDGKTYKGFKGFSQWFDGIKDLVEEGSLHHDITKFDAKKVKTDEFVVTFDVKTTGKMKDGTALAFDVKEEWSLRKDQGQYIFKSYTTTNK